MNSIFNETAFRNSFVIEYHIRLKHNSWKLLNVFKDTRRVKSSSKKLQSLQKL